MSLERLSIGELVDSNEIQIHNNQRAPLSRMERDRMKQGQCFPYYGAASQIDEVNEWKFDGDFLLVARLPVFCIGLDLFGAISGA